MFSRVNAGALCGILACPVSVEVDIAPGLPGFQMVGYLGSEVREAKERVRVALKNAGLQIPAMSVHVNLAPADVRKEGTGFDLPIAIGLLTALSHIEQNRIEGILFAGELGLNGEIRPVKGVLPITAMAKEAGMEICLVPKENAREAALIEGMKVIGVETIHDALSYVTADDAMRDELIAPTVAGKDCTGREVSSAHSDFKNIKGQTFVKRAALIAAAGFHNLLMVGPPGSGKTMVAGSIAGILPPLSMEERLEVTTVYSVAGLLSPEQPLVADRPFVSPHHTITRQALVGGGTIPRPGIVSQAHRGVLFLDELTEFPRANLDLLRQPLEEKKIHIARSQGNYVFPAHFMLVGACNPCPCGFYPDLTRCRCTEYEIHRYLNRISGPFLDRFDVCVETPRVELCQLQGESTDENSETMAKKVFAARSIQRERFINENIVFNSEMDVELIQKYCDLGKKEKTFLEKTYQTMNLSARSYHRILKTARTIADLDQSEKIGEQHLMEAICFRVNAEKFWK